MLKFLNK